MELSQLVFVVLSSTILIGIVLHSIGLLSLLRFRFRKVPRLPVQGAVPGVTVIKPCFSNLDNEEENFDSFFRQDYPGKFQILFVVSHDSDPIVPIVRKLIARHPEVDAQLVVSRTRKAYWLKIDALYDAHQLAKHEMIIWSDSDTVVRSNYLTQMVSYLQDPKISLVTTPQYDARVNNFATALKTLGNNTDIACYVMIYDLFTVKKKTAFGHSLGFRQSDLKKFEDEAWHTLRNSFADDLVMPILFSKHGKKVVFRNIYCPVQYSGKSLSSMIHQQERFFLCQRVVIGRWKFLAGLALSPQVPATLLLLLAPFHPYTLHFFTAALATRISLSFCFEALILQSIRMNLRYFWTIPLWDLMRVYLVAYAFIQNKVEYHGKMYRLTGNLNLKEIKATPNPEALHTEWAQPGNDSASAHSPL